MLKQTLRPVWAEINLENAAYNIQNIIKYVSSSASKNGTKSPDIIGIVKANAYGHGAVEISKVLLNNGVKKLGVATLNEAIELRDSCIDCPIIMLGITPSMYLQTIIDYNLTPVISSLENAQCLSELLKKNASTIEETNKTSQPKVDKKCTSPFEIYVAIDTGMGRIGFLPNEKGFAEIEQISKFPYVSIHGLFSHFAVADEKDKTYSKEQIRILNKAYETLYSRGLKIENRTICNSAGTMELSDAHFEEVRPGIILYGTYPSDAVDKTIIDLRPVMSVKANIVLIKDVPEETSISYGRKFITKRESKIATITIGYADGYPRLLTGKARVIINGVYAPIVGTICMDQCMIDVTDVPNIKVNDEVILLGSDGNLEITAVELAEKANTINYEILSRMGNRIPRVFI